MKAALLIAASASISLAAEPNAPAPGTGPAKPASPMGELGKPKPKAVAVKNGDFSAAAADGKPDGWTAAYPTGTFSVVKDAGESFLRVEVNGEPANGGATQIVPVPPGSITAVVRGRMRGKPGKTPRAAAQLVFWPKGPASVTIPPTILESQHSAAWKTESREVPLLPNVKTLEVSARCVFATGKFDFDDIEVQFK